MGFVDTSLHIAHGRNREKLLLWYSLVVVMQHLIHSGITIGNSKAGEVIVPRISTCS